MKNQYLGDVGDYGKYGLFRYLANNDIRIGINWYLTADDGSNDGKFVSYLDKDEERRYDPELFDELKKIVHSRTKNVNMVEACGLIPQATYYNSLLESKMISRDERERGRNLWHQNALSHLADAELIFADPDNGIIGTKSIFDN